MGWTLYRVWELKRFQEGFFSLPLWISHWSQIRPGCIIFFNSVSFILYEIVRYLNSVNCIARKMELTGCLHLFNITRAFQAKTMNMDRTNHCPWEWPCSLPLRHQVAYTGTVYSITKFLWFLVLNHLSMKILSVLRCLLPTICQGYPVEYRYKRIL